MQLDDQFNYTYYNSTDLGITYLTQILQTQ